MIKNQNEISLNALFEVCQTRLQNIFSTYLSHIPSLELKEAMQSVLANGGKRIRPLLIFATGIAFNASWENLDVPAASVELIHTYSLIHDDLPSMDNADLRRGKPSCHKRFGEGIAILAGDALHTLAMQIVASQPAALKAKQRVEMMAVLSQACGPYGMAGGQALDITLMTDKALSADTLLEIYQLKTGALLSACIKLGYIASSEDNEINVRALEQFGNLIGTAFQIQDDILDIEAATQELGKPQGIDYINNKVTYPALVGLEVARDKMTSLYHDALETINYLGHKVRLLRQLITQMMLMRKK